MLFYVKYGCDNSREELIVDAESEEKASEYGNEEAQNLFDSYDCGVDEEDYDSYDDYLEALDDERIDECYCYVESYDENNPIHADLMSEYGAHEI